MLAFKKKKKYLKNVFVNISAVFVKQINKEGICVFCWCYPFDSVFLSTLETRYGGDGCDNLETQNRLSEASAATAPPFNRATSLLRSNIQIALIEHRIFSTFISTPH